MARPTKYKEEYCEMLIEHMSKGFSYETFGAVIDVSKQTIYDWEKVNPEFLDAKRKAFGKCRIFWERIGIEGTTGDLPMFKTGSWVFNMKNRFNWTDKQEIVQDTRIEINIDEDDVEL